MDNEQASHAADRADTPSVPSGQSADEDAGDARRLATIAASVDTSLLTAQDAATLEVQTVLLKQEQRIEDLTRSIDLLRSEVRRMTGAPDQGDASPEDLKWLVDRLLDQQLEIERRGRVILELNDRVAQGGALEKARDAAIREMKDAIRERDAALQAAIRLRGAYRTFRKSRVGRLAGFLLRKNPLTGGKKTAAPGGQ